MFRTCRIPVFVAVALAAAVGGSAGCAARDGGEAGTAAGGRADKAGAAGADFVVSVVGEQFVVRLVTPEQIALARARVNGTKPQGIVSGKLVDGGGGFNRDVRAGRPWSWHLDPASVHFPDLAAEVCDGRPSDVEGAKEHWVREIKMYCPWAAKIERELLPGGNDWTYRQDFAKGANWDEDKDGCKVRWCGEKDWAGKTGCDAAGALRLIDKGDETIVLVYFGDRDFSRATLKLKYYHIQRPGDPANAAGSRLQARVGSDEDPSCDTAGRGTYRTIRDLNATTPVAPTPSCTEDEGSVEIKAGDTVVYWKFLKGSYPTALIVDDVTITLSGTRTQPATAKP